MKLRRPAKQGTHNGFRPPSHPLGRHSGEDYGWGSGTGVYAAAEGVVEYVYSGGEYNRGWGNRIIIRHTDQCVTTYNHLAQGSIRVREEQRVAVGERLGTMGSTGKSPNGKHLHFELYVDGSRVDPHPYFRRHLPGSAPTASRPFRPNGPQQRVVRHTTNRRGQPTLAGAVKRPQLRRGTVGFFDGFIRGEEVTQNGVTSRIWFRGAFSHDWFWAGNFTTTSTRGLEDLGTFSA